MDRRGGRGRRALLRQPPPTARSPPGAPPGHRRRTDRRGPPPLWSRRSADVRPLAVCPPGIPVRRTHPRHPGAVDPGHRERAALLGTRRADPPQLASGRTAFAAPHAPPQLCGHRHRAGSRRRRRARPPRSRRARRPGAVVAPGRAHPGHRPGERPRTHRGPGRLRAGRAHRGDALRVRPLCGGPRARSRTRHPRGWFRLPVRPGGGGPQGRAGGRAHLGVHPGCGGRRRLGVPGGRSRDARPWPLPRPPRRPALSRRLRARVRRRPGPRGPRPGLAGRPDGPARPTLHRTRSRHGPGHRDRSRQPHRARRGARRRGAPGDHRGPHHGGRRRDEPARRPRTGLRADPQRARCLRLLRLPAIRGRRARPGWRTRPPAAPGDFTLAPPPHM